MISLSQLLQNYLSCSELFTLRSPRKLLEDKGRTLLSFPCFPDHLMSYQPWVLTDKKYSLGDRRMCGPDELEDCKGGKVGGTMDG